MEKIILTYGSNRAMIFSLGATVGSIELSKNGQTHSILDGYTTIDDVRKGVGSKSALMIPFPNRIRDGMYVFDGVKHQLPLNKADEGHAIHGLVLQQNFDIVEQKEGSVSLRTILEPSEGYPFRLEILVRYVLDDGFSVHLLIKNIGEQSAPVGAGWHPYFMLGPVDGLGLKLDAKTRVVIDDRMVPTGEESYTTFQERRVIGDTKFDDGFVGEGAVLYTKDFALICWQDLPYIQIYTPPHRNSIAIEPMSCKTDAFNNGDGLKVLKPGADFKARFGVRIE